MECSTGRLRFLLSPILLCLPLYAISMFAFLRQDPGRNILFSPLPAKSFFLCYCPKAMRLSAEATSDPGRSWLFSFQSFQVLFCVGFSPTGPFSSLYWHFPTAFPLIISSPVKRSLCDEHSLPLPSLEQPGIPISLHSRVSGTLPFFLIFSPPNPGI